VTNAEIVVGGAVAVEVEGEVVVGAAVVVVGAVEVET
jgi:hypothetical protein